MRGPPPPVPKRRAPPPFPGRGAPSRQPASGNPPPPRVGPPTPSTRAGPPTPSTRAGPPTPSTRAGPPPPSARSGPPPPSARSGLPPPSARAGLPPPSARSGPPPPPSARSGQPIPKPLSSRVSQLNAQFQSHSGPRPQAPEINIEKALEPDLALSKSPEIEPESKQPPLPPPKPSSVKPAPKPVQTNEDSIAASHIAPKIKIPPRPNMKINKEAFGSGPPPLPPRSPSFSKISTSRVVPRGSMLNQSFSTSNSFQGSDSKGSSSFESRFSFTQEVPEPDKYQNKLKIYASSRINTAKNSQTSAPPSSSSTITAPSSKGPPPPPPLPSSLR